MIPVRSPYELVRESRLAQAAGQPAMTSGVPEDPIVRAQKMIASMRQNAPQGIDPRMAALLDRQMARVADREKEVEREGKRTPWEALMRAGAAMASSRSPFFAPALAAGAMAAADTFQERRLAAAKARAMAEGQRDQIEMERLRAEGAGMRAADESLDRAVRLAGDLGEADLRAAQAMKARAEAIPDPKMRELELRKAEMQIKEIESKIAENRAQATKALREGRSGGSDVEGRADRTELDKAAARYRAAAMRYEQARKRAGGVANIEDPKVVDDYMAARAELEGLSSAFERRYGSTPYIGGRNPSVGPLVKPSRPAGGSNNDPLGLRR